MDVTGFIGLLGGWSVIVIAVSAWLSRLATERVMSKWRRDEQSVVERLRSELERNTLLLETGIRSFGSGQDVIRERQVAAVERFWAAVLDLREQLKGPLFFFGILMPSEYDAALRKCDSITASIEDVDDNMIVEAMKATAKLETDRPHLGETLWLRFFIYRAVLGRLSYLVVEGRRTAHIPDWLQDRGIQQLIGHVVPKADLDQLLKTTPPVAVNRALNTLEGLLLEEISRITSGQRSSLQSFENAKALHDAMANMSPRV